MYPNQMPAPMAGAPTANPFAAAAPAPAPGDRIQAKQCIGHLLILVPVAFKPSFFPAKKKDNGEMGTPSDAVQLDLVDLDVFDPATGQRGRAYHDVMWGAGRVAGSLAESLRTNPPGTPVLARMVEGMATGQGVPLELANASSDQAAVAVAMEFMARRPNWRNERAATPAPQPTAYTPAPAGYVPAPQQTAYAPQAMPVQQAPAYPAAIPQVAPQAAPAPAAPQPAAAPNLAQMDPAVLAQLDPAVLAQLQAMQAQPQS